MKLIHETNYGWDKNEAEVSRSLAALQLFKLSQPTPAVLSLVRAYRNSVIKYSKLRDTLDAIEKFHFVFTAVTSSRSSGGISAMYSSLARKLYEAEDSHQASKEIQLLIVKLRDKRPSLDEFIVAFKEICFTNTNSKQKNLVRYILRKFSEFYSYKYPVQADDLTIEHIHPQSKSHETGWDENVVGMLGNLIFLDQKMNGQLDTKTFKEKLLLLEKKGYSIPSFLGGKTSWVVSDVESHTENMANVAYNNIWKI